MELLNTRNTHLLDLVSKKRGRKLGGILDTRLEVPGRLDAFTYISHTAGKVKHAT